MAKKLKALPKAKARSRREEYPFDEWLNGEVWQLSRKHNGSGDFDAKKASNFSNTLKRAAERRGLDPNRDVTIIVVDDNTLAVQAHRSGS